MSDGLLQSIYHLTLQVCLFALFCGMTHYNSDKTIFSGMEVTEPDWSELREEKVEKRVKQWEKTQNDLALNYWHKLRAG